VQSHIQYKEGLPNLREILSYMRKPSVIQCMTVHYIHTCRTQFGAVTVFDGDF